MGENVFPKMLRFLGVFFETGRKSPLDFGGIRMFLF